MQSLKGARAATGLFFLVNGAVVGCWVPFIPERAHALGLSAGRLGTVLLGGGVGALIAMPLAGHLIPRLGSRIVSTVCAAGFAAALFLNVWMPTRWGLLASLILFGMAGAGMDVSMNAQAVLLEDRQGSRVLSSLHGLFSLGNVVGSLGISAAFARGVPPKPLAGVAAAILSAAVLGSGGFMLGDDAGTAATGSARRFDPRLFLLGSLVVAAMVCEGGTADWSGLYLRNGRGLGQGWAGVGYGVFATLMLLGRLSGDRVVAPLGEVRTLRLGGLVAVAGALLIVLGPGTAAALFGFALFGTGLANSSPVLYRAAGQVPGVPAGVGLATAVGMGYAGLLAGPPLLGGVGQVWGLRSIFPVLGLLCVLLSANARVCAVGLRPNRSGVLS